MTDYYDEYIPGNYSVYEYLQKETKNYLSSTAISFYGKNFSYETMFQKIDEVARALKAYGVKKDDVVASSLPGTPEGIYIIYAINKIGAVYCAFDCRSKSEEIRETLRTFKPKICIVPDFQIKELKGVCDCTIVHLSPIHSLGGFVKITSHVANLFTGRTRLYISHKNFVSYDEFIKGASYGENLPPEKSSDNVFGFFYTSGTTYGRKSIILTNENINAAAIQQKAANPEIKSGNSILNIMPLFTCYSVTIAVHLPLISGVRVNLIPLVNTKKLKKVLLKEKPNYIITVPAHWEFFIKERFNNCDLSFLKTIIVGGDSMHPEYEHRLYNILKACGSSAFIAFGYGLSETTSTATVSINCSLKGSVGRPLKNTLIGIFDKDTLKPLLPNEKGEICICGPTVCNGYFNDEAMTKALLKKHDDGRIWLHSGDLGYINEEGFLFFCERIKRMYVRYDGTKISPYSIEQVISTSPIVERCMIVNIRDKDHTHGMCARALIVLRENVSKKYARDRLQKFFQKNLDQHMIPKEVVFVDALPYTKNGKLDYFSSSQM